MRIPHLYITILAIAPFWLSACATSSEPKGIDADAFHKHFLEQGACMTYVNSLVNPTAKALSAISTPEEMRSWLSNHPDEKFSWVVDEIRSDTKVFGPLDPLNEADQRKVSASVLGPLERAPGFRQSSCGTDVNEYVTESLYLGLGGQGSAVARELDRRGIKDSWNQRLVLLTFLMAGELESDRRN